jgi:hypothetical protein
MEKYRHTLVKDQFDHESRNDERKSGSSRWLGSARRAQAKGTLACGKWNTLDSQFFRVFVVSGFRDPYRRTRMGYDFKPLSAKIIERAITVHKALGPGFLESTARLFRPGKPTISAELTGIFDRLGTNGRSWQVKMRKLRTSRLLGRIFAASQAILQEIAERLNVRYVVNLIRCPVR